MIKRVIVLASGETERRALPHLVSHLRKQSVSVEEIRIPPRNRRLDVRMAENLIKAVWSEKTESPPDKFVLLVDVDGKPPDDVLTPFREHLPGRLVEAEIDVPVQYAFAQWHLESWYFADAKHLEEYLGRDLGSIDMSTPSGSDAIQNPKLHLKHLLLGRQVYTARVSEEMARRLDAPAIAKRSPSFKGFLDALMNGPRAADN